MLSTARVTRRSENGDAYFEEHSTELSTKPSVNPNRCVKACFPRSSVKSFTRRKRVRVFVSYS